MVPVNVADIVYAVAAAQRLYSIGFRNVNNAGQKYRDFGEDIRLLAVNLDLISNVVQRAQSQATTIDGAGRNVNPVQRPIPAAHQVLGNFRETLSDCERLLDDQRYFTKRDGIVSNVSFYYQIDPEVQKLRDRVAFHNIKLSVCLKILEPSVFYSLSNIRPRDTDYVRQILGDRFIQIWDPTNAILGAIEELGRQIRSEEGRDDPSIEPLGPVIMPQELEDGFTTMAQNVFPNLSAIPLDRGVDTVVSYFNMVTKTPDQLVQNEIRYLMTIINVMKASWLLQAIKAGQDYQYATRYCSPHPAEQQMDRWGMTMERFFNKLEETIYEAFRYLLGRHLLLPPTPDLLELFEKERRIWHVSPAYTPKQGIEPIELGTDLGAEVFSAHLRSSDPNYTETLQVYRQTEKRFSLVLVKAAISEGRDKEITDGYDLGDVQIIPSYASRTWTSPSLDPQTIIFRTDTHSPVYRKLAFYQTKDMFEFQQAITGYKVVHDDARVLATIQESKFLGGTRRQDLCRLQIWTATPKADGSMGGQTPYLASTSASSTGLSQTSFTSIRPTEPSRKSSIFTLSNLSGLKNSTNSNSSSSSRSFITTNAQTLPKFVASTGGATVYAPPVTPCIVLFAHKVPEKGQGEESLRSFLIIDVAMEVEMVEGEHTDALSYRCVLESKGSYLPATRSPETSDPNKWDLAVAGLHKRHAGTEAVKRLKHIIIQFDTQNNLSQFITKFKQVQDLAKLRFSQFLQATGQG